MVLISLAVGFNGSEHGKRAGMVTTMLVSLAASVAMIQVNLLLPMAGRGPSSFIMNDLMRLPLGVLTGIGFIGAGAILRHGSDVAGVTTPATLRLMTVAGLCRGGGQLLLGLSAGALALVALSALKRFENSIRSAGQCGTEDHGKRSDAVPSNPARTTCPRRQDDATVR